jgi:putative peptide zinc metalloprotease protein
MAGIIDAAPSAQKSPPPRLRQELNLFPAEPDLDGSPAWILHDPLTNRHFRLGQLEVDLLVFVEQGSDEEKIAQLATIKIGHQVAPAQVLELFEFLRRNNLTVADEVQKSWYRRQLALLGNQGVLTQLVKSYLFFRVPVLKPDRFLANTLKYVVWAGSTPSFICLGVLFLLGTFLAIRQMDSFINTFMHFFNPEGFGAYLVALAFVKIFHELGHGYTAKKMGCKVPIIGVAFLVGWPVLYTDTSDAWKLNSRSKRLKIGAAGIAVELSIAIISLFCWSLATDGIMRSVFFLLATTTWVMSILVNCNPLMRFDGYYLLSDWLRTPNLDTRSGAMARWLLREKLFALHHPPPEPVQNRMLLFAYSVWIYRFLLYLGIAALVYYFFFKALGLILFAIEVIYFILRPFYNEFKEWYKFWPEITWNKTTMRSSLLLLIILGLGFIPWRSSINAAAFIKARYTPLYTQVPGQVTQIAVANNTKVNKGQVLVTMADPELSYEKEQVQRRYEELSWQRAALGFDEKMRSEAIIVSSALFSQNQRLRGLLKKQEKLTITAPESGIVADLTPEIRVGDWLAEGTPVLALLDGNDLTIIAYIEEADLTRLKPGFKGLFYPEKGTFQPLDVEIIEIESMAIKSLDALYSASLFGGDVAVRKNKQDELIPVISTYQLRLKLLNKPTKLERVMRGTAVLEGEAESFFMRAKNRLYAVLRRESGF